MTYVNVISAMISGGAITASVIGLAIDMPYMCITAAGVAIANLIGYEYLCKRYGKNNAKN